MRDEHSYALNLKKTNEFKSIEFSRISLTTFNSDLTNQELIFKELINFIYKLHQSETDMIYASANEDRTVYLITTQFKNGTLNNLLLSFINNSPTYQKRIEISGNDGLYEYNSIQEDSYYSDFLRKQPYIPIYKLDNDSSKINKFIANINLSILLKKPIHT